MNSSDNSTRSAISTSAHPSRDISPVADPELATARSVPLLPLLTRLAKACAAKYLYAGSSDLNKFESTGIECDTELDRFVSLSWNSNARSKAQTHAVLSSSP
jgi:hypothetical protein